MASNDELFPVYVCTYTIDLLSTVEEETFETRMVQEIMPRTTVSRRTFQRLELEHYLLKGHDNQYSGKYQWQFQILAFELVSHETDYSWAFKAIDEDVNDALDGLGRPVAMTIHREIGRVRM